jgi:hypothetical protein
VTAWVEPTGTTWGGTPSAANVARIKAVRVVLVARSREPEGTQVSAACTNPASVANTGPCSFQDASAPVIDLSTVPVPSGKTWRNYRYRVHQAVIPLRSVDEKGAGISDCAAETGNYRVQYVIERMCSSSPTLSDIADIRAKCAYDASASAVSATSIGLHYRVLIRVRGPRGTLTWYEAMVSGPASI